MTAYEAAVRIDPTTGIREEVTFFGSHPPHMFGTTHLPAGDVRGGVVICASIHAELIKAYRKEVLVARALAAAGIAVQRFHYRGAGNSEGTGEELNVDAMIESVAEARSELARHAGGLDRIAYLGTRLGAYPATAAAEEVPGTPLVLWSPIQDTDAFMREVFRSHYIAALKGEDKPEPTARMIERVHADGQIELLGYKFTDSFYSSLDGRRLDAFSPKGSPVLLVPFGHTDFDSLAEVWTAAGADVTPFTSSTEEAWWLGRVVTEPEDSQERTVTLVTGTAQWLVQQLTGDSPLN